MLIRRANPADAAAIERLYQQLLTHPAICVSAHRVEQALLDANTALLVAEQDDTVVGSALLGFCMDVMFGEQPYAMIENVIVDMACRGNGVGRALISEAESIARGRQCSKIMLLSTVTRKDAHRFFERAGYSGATKQGFVKYSRDFGSRP